MSSEVIESNPLFILMQEVATMDQDILDRDVIDIISSSPGAPKSSKSNIAYDDVAAGFLDANNKRIIEESVIAMPKQSMKHKLAKWSRKMRLSTCEDGDCDSGAAASSSRRLSFRIRPSSAQRPLQNVNSDSNLKRPNKVSSSGAASTFLRIRSKFSHSVSMGEKKHRLFGNKFVALFPMTSSISRGWEGHSRHYQEEDVAHSISNRFPRKQGRVDRKV